MSALVAALNRGALLQREGRLEEALSLYGELAAANPRDAEPVVRLATVHSEMGRHDAALAFGNSGPLSNGQHLVLRLLLSKLPDLEHSHRRRNFGIRVKWSIDVKML